MSHAHAALTPRARLRLAKLIVEEKWSPTAAATMFMGFGPDCSPMGSQVLSRRTGRDGRPLESPALVPARPGTSCASLCTDGWRQRLGPVQVGGRLGLAPSTVHAVLVRCRLNRLSQIDRVTGEPIRRYEHPHPGMEPERRHGNRRTGLGRQRRVLPIAHMGYARFYSSETVRRLALPDWIHSCNHHRTHSAIGDQPISRINNLPEHHN